MDALDNVFFAVENATDKAKMRIELTQSVGYEKTKLEILKKYREDLAAALRELSDVIGEQV